jgi:predicted HAD superfamily Cof-like phosphohydrolase
MFLTLKWLFMENLSQSHCNAIITKHAYQRAKERLSLGRPSIEKLANTALSKGVKHKDMKGKLKKYADKLWFMYNNANNLRVYGQNVFIFNENTLITIYHIPRDLIKYINL